MSQLRSFVRAIAILSSLAMLGCGEEEESPGGASPGPNALLEIAGTWEDDFGSTEIIADRSWDTIGEGFTASSEIVRFDNDENVLVTRGPDFDDPEKDVYGRVVWTEVEDGSFYYCIVLFGQETLTGALLATGVNDRSDPEAAGCGENDFPWTRLSAQ